MTTAGVQAVYAGFWRRTWALLIDLVVLYFVWQVIDSLTHGHNAGRIFGLAWLTYQVGLTMEGGTVGKRALALRVVRSDGSRIDLIRAFVRELVGKPISALAMGMGFLWVLDDRRRQSWHDRMTDTVVVRELRVEEAPPWRFNPPWVKGSVVPLQPPPAGAPAPSSSPPGEDPDEAVTEAAAPFALEPAVAPPVITPGPDTPVSPQHEDTAGNDQGDGSAHDQDSGTDTTADDASRND